MKDFIYGIHSVKEAILSGKTIDKILIQKGTSQTLSEIKQLSKKYQISIQEVPLVVLEKLCYQKNHQGIAAYLSPIEYQPVEEIVTRTFEFGETPFLVLLDGVTDVRNLGAIARSAECMGVHALILPRTGSAKINQDAIKTSAGAFHYLPVCKEENLKKTILTLKAMGIQILACTEKTNKLVHQFDLSQPICFILGDEGKGISSSLLKLCDDKVSIPMFGQIESLNVSVAAGIIFYETQKQRNCITL
jgi:23S rRNA (guanosine2251-2'-O)-methyltransferase